MYRSSSVVVGANHAICVCLTEEQVAGVKTRCTAGNLYPPLLAPFRPSSGTSFSCFSFVASLSFLYLPDSVMF